MVICVDLPREPMQKIIQGRQVAVDIANRNRAHLAAFASWTPLCFLITSRV
jgi:hypothetical protein